MADREKVINDLQDAVNDDWMWQHADYYAKAMENAIALLKEQEAVVRCKDCKHSEPWYGDKSRCFLWHETGIDVFNDGFCNYGKRKEGR